MPGGGECSIQWLSRYLEPGDWARRLQRQVETKGGTQVCWLLAPATRLYLLSTQVEDTTRSRLQAKLPGQVGPQ